ncbi:DDE superfamily endonuclease [Phytophthora infestans]|uniref:DDE superfamily endonuclease n=1 Tax=Phytophthora infestans TaxID=4787 RepID=A0A8S9UBQ7_PHYIN|nr:DDE superfamily endonuclease [Phytophthora infestans]
MYLVQPATPSQLLQNEPKYAGQFGQCRLAFDGTHIPAYVPSEKAKLFRDRTGKLSQNVFAACTFDMQFVYVLSGSAEDSTMLVDARRKGIKTPPGLFDLGDAEYGLTTEVMTPYRGVRYHLKEWGQTEERPQNYKELYNLRHPQACNVIERAFGVLKRRFPILKQAPEYSVDTQAKIVRVCCVLHNFIRLQEDLPDDPEGELEEEDSDDERPDTYNHESSTCTNGNYRRACNLRDLLAKNMWDSYVAFQR